MPRTDDINEVLGGFYVGECCYFFVAMPIGDRFPACPQCCNATSFRLVLRPADRWSLYDS